VLAQAVETSTRLHGGNLELQKAVKRREESSHYIVMIMLLAALMLLFVDWLGSSG